MINRTIKMILHSKIDIRLSLNTLYMHKNYSQNFYLVTERCLKKKKKQKKIVN